MPASAALKRRATDRARTARHALRLWLAGRVIALGHALRLGTFIRLDFPPTREPGPRYGHGRPPHAGLAATLAAGTEDFRAAVEAIGRHAADLGRIPLRTQTPGEPEWANGWMPGLDAGALYAFVRDRAPAQYLEIGSGSSTRFAARARRDGALATRIVSIDPSPRADIDALCDEVVRCGLEQVDVGRFADLAPGDIVFFDGSHRTYTNSDVTVFFLDILPLIPAGVLVGVHDIYIPDDYPPEIASDFYSEQYMLAAWMVAAPDALRTVLPAHFCAHDPALSPAVDALWARVGVAGVERHGVAFWFEKAA